MLGTRAATGHPPTGPTDGSALQLGVLGASHVVPVEKSPPAMARGGAAICPRTRLPPQSHTETRQGGTRHFSAATCVNAARGQPGGWAVVFPVTPR